MDSFPYMDSITLFTCGAVCSNRPTPQVEADTVVFDLQFKTLVFSDHGHLNLCRRGMPGDICQSLPVDSVDGLFGR